jgi:hypothetical protein
MARYPWFPLWIDDLCSSTNFQRIRWSTQGVYLNILRYVRREPELLGLVCHAGGKAIGQRELAMILTSHHRERVERHIECLFEVELLEWDGPYIRASKFREKVLLAVRMTGQIVPQMGDKTSAGSADRTKRGQNGDETSTFGPGRSNDGKDLRRQESESESDKDINHTRVCSELKNLSSEPPPELASLSLYAKDEKLCKRWPALYPEWRKAYPGVDVLGEVRKAHAWEISNPRRIKKDRARFLAAWLARAQDRGGGLEPEGGLEKIRREIEQERRKQRADG